MHDEIEFYVDQIYKLVVLNDEEENKKNEKIESENAQFQKKLEETVKKYEDVINSLNKEIYTNL